MFAISEQCSICPLSSPLVLDLNLVYNTVDRKNPPEAPGLDDRKDPPEVPGVDGGGKPVEVDSLFPLKTLPNFSE